MIEVKVKRGLSSEVAEKLHKHPNILKVYEITGRADAVIEACFRDINELNIFLKEIRKSMSRNHRYSKPYCLK
ncbi:MAG: Lrp/AsnC ligand binding domain-containing protein [Desulfurococcales archaeon]|nr:Lrp/AsnC ligand binding domain-containing protein [Desulfurococcales archaeon]